MTSRSARPDSGYRSETAHLRRAALLAISLLPLACTTLSAPGEKLEKRTEAATYTADIMPNDLGFYFPSRNEDLKLQGGWYWYDSSIQSAEVTEVYVYQHEGLEFIHENRYYWLLPDGRTETEARPRITSPDQRVARLCVEGDAENNARLPADRQYIAIGFEVCSTRDIETPPEFPSPLGRCMPNGVPTRDVDKFQGITFDLDTEDALFGRIEVQFKPWNEDDDLLPFCVYQEGGEHNEGKEIPCAYEDLGDGRIRLFASALDVAIADPDTEVEEMYTLNLSMLQAIHIQIYPTEETETVRLCIENATAFGGQNDEARVGAIEPPEDEACVLEDLSDNTAPGVEGEWVSIGTANPPFDILKTEVTAAQFAACCDAGVCGQGNGEPNEPWRTWETCTVNYFQETGDNTYATRAANCIPWCEARRFCNWLGGRLPLESEWEAAAAVGAPPMSEIDCEIAVINGTRDDAIGVGCGETRIPAHVCSKQHNISVPPDPDGQLCDMAGNLWEWLEDDAAVTGEDDWRHGYKKLKGGSLNSTDQSNAFQDGESTIEHPTVPHSPTRIGFRCVRDAEQPLGHSER